MIDERSIPGTYSDLMSFEMMINHMNIDITKQELRAIIKGIEAWKRNGKQEPIWLCFKDQHEAWECTEHLSMLAPQARCICMGNVIVIAERGELLERYYNLYKVQHSLVSKLTIALDKQYPAEGSAPIELCFENGEQAHLAQMFLHHYYGATAMVITATEPKVIVSLGHLKTHSVYSYH